MTEHPVDLLTRNFPACEVNAWSLKPGATLDISPQWPVRGWRYAYAVHDADGWVLQNVIPGSPAVSVDARHGVDVGFNDCTSTAAAGSNPSARPMTAAPCAIGRCGYRVVRDWADVFAVFQSVHADALARGQITAMPPLIIVRVRAWGRIAAADSTDPLGTIRVQRFAVGAVLHDESLAQYQPALRAAYPSVATMYSDRPLPDLAAQISGAKFDTTTGGGIARMIRQQFAVFPRVGGA